MTEEEVLDTVIDLWADVRPYGTLPDDYEAVARLVIGAVRLKMMRKKELVYVNGAAYWRDKQTGEVDNDMGNGCAEIAASGRMYAHVTGACRPQPGDLKPSESLIRSQRQIQLDSEERAREAKRERLKQQLRDLDNGV